MFSWRDNHHRRRGIDKRRAEVIDTVTPNISTLRAFTALLYRGINDIGRLQAMLASRRNLGSCIVLPRRVASNVM